MRTIFLTTLLEVLFCLPGLLQAQALDWAVSAAGPGEDKAEAIATDAAGGSCVAGTFVETATFGLGQANEATLVSTLDGRDVFLARYDSAGLLEWARAAGGNDADDGWGVAADAEGSCYIAGRLGRFTTSATFGNGVTLEDPGAFAAKYDMDGNALWATHIDPNGLAFGVDVGPGGDSYVAGQAPDPTLGGGIVTLWKLDAGGGLEWARQGLGSYSGSAAGVAVDSAGNAAITGRVQGGSATFGAGEVNETVLTDTSGSQTVVAKYTSSGALLWADQTEDAVGSFSFGDGISTDGNDAIWVVGNGSGTLDPGGLNETAVQDTFVAQFDSGGSLQWAKSNSGNGSPIEGKHVAGDAAGNGYVTGFFTTSATFGGGEPNEVTLPSLAGFRGGDIFVASYGPDGAFRWARQAGGAVDNGLFEIGNGVAADGDGNAYAAGVYSGSAVFGPGEPNETTLTSAAASDWNAFVAKYSNDAAVSQEDLDVAQFRVTKRVSLSRPKPVEVKVAVRNNGTVVAVADATVVGTQNGGEVYRRTLSVTDGVGNGRTTYDFPSFTPTNPGEIAWSLTIDDVDPDLDEEATATSVVP